MFTLSELSRLLRPCAGAVLLLVTANAIAVPSFTRQTGRPCSGCHTVFAELTPYGREFKLGGFVAGDKLDAEKWPLSLPLTVSGVLSNTSTRKTSDAPDSFPHDRDTIIQDASLYYGGRIVDHVGALVQYKYHAASDMKWGTEMAEIRYANETTLGNEKQLIYGATINNNPSIADVYNGTPMWSFPHQGTVVGLVPNAAAMVDNSLASQVGGVGMYARWNELVYVEFDVYHKGTGVFHPLTSGVHIANVVDGYAPYWRLALQYESTPHSFEIGTFGLDVKIFPDASQPRGPTDHFRDVGLDSQYQYIKGDHIISAHVTYIHEQQRWDASYPVMTSNPSSTLTTARADVHYIFRRRFGGILQHFSTSGDIDLVRYNNGDAVAGSVSGSPDTSGWRGQLFYLPIQNIQLGVQYTAYAKFNGASSNYSGSGRRAADNNALNIYLWVLY